MDGLPACRCSGTIVVASFVKLDTAHNNSIMQSGANGIVFGVSQLGSRAAPIPDIVADPPQAGLAGESIRAYRDGEFCLLHIGASVTTGDKLKADASGFGTPCVSSVGTKENYGAIALESGSAGEYIKVLVTIGINTTET